MFLGEKCQPSPNGRSIMGFSRPVWIWRVWTKTDLQPPLNGRQNPARSNLNLKTRPFHRAKIFRTRFDLLHRMIFDPYSGYSNVFNIGRVGLINNYFNFEPPGTSPQVESSDRVSSPGCPKAVSARWANGTSFQPTGVSLHMAGIVRTFSPS